MDSSPGKRSRNDTPVFEYYAPCQSHFLEKTASPSKVSVRQCLRLNSGGVGEHLLTAFVGVVVCCRRAPGGDAFPNGNLVVPCVVGCGRTIFQQLALQLMLLHDTFLPGVFVWRCLSVSITLEQHLYAQSLADVHKSQGGVAVPVEAKAEH